MEELDEIENENVSKQRHGCVTAWLALMIIANSFTAIVYFFSSDLITQGLTGNISTVLIVAIGMLSVANVVFAIMLFQWKKIGFWGFVLTSFAALIININIGVDIGQSLFGLVGIIILFGVLQIKKDNTSAWDYLE